MDSCSRDIGQDEECMTLPLFNPASCYVARLRTVVMSKSSVRFCRGPLSPIVDKHNCTNHTAGRTTSPARLPRKQTDFLSYRPLAFVAAWRSHAAQKPGTDRTVQGITRHKSGQRIALRGSMWRNGMGLWRFQRGSVYVYCICRWKAVQDTRIRTGVPGNTPGVRTVSCRSGLLLVA
jgi:hypothetical protein